MTNREFINKFVPEDVKDNFLLLGDDFILDLKFSSVNDILFSCFDFTTNGGIEKWLKVVAITDMKYRAYLMEKTLKNL